jgi:hypothetical protein
MPDPFQDHLDVGIIESYVFRELAEPELAPVDEHLLVCENCRQAVAEMDVFAPLLRPETTRGLGRAAYVHLTVDGAVTLEISALPESRWSARFHGRHLEGQTVLESPRDACSYLRRSFSEMYPEHLCTAECGPED